MKRTAVLRICFCHGVSGGSANVRASSRNADTSHSPKCRARAAEYAASAWLPRSPGDNHCPQLGLCPRRRRFGGGDLRRREERDEHADMRKETAAHTCPIGGPLYVFNWR